MSDTPVDIGAVRKKLAGLSGRQYWQGLDELAETDEFMEYLHREFPRQAAVWDAASSQDDGSSRGQGSSHGMTRRSFFKLLGASLALAGLSGCVNVPARKIVPYVKSPDTNQIPGKSLYYTTAMTHVGYAMGLLVESNEGRPTKVEGNPDHPASLGATDTFGQASVLGLYDPARSTMVLHNGQHANYADFTQAFAADLAAASANGGAGVRILSEVTSSPTLIAQMESIQRALPNAAWLRWEPAANDLADVGARLAFGQDVNTVYRFDRADTILSLDSDFLQSHADTLRYARDFIERRRIRSATGGSMNRLYAFEGSPTLTGAKADHRWRVLSRDVLTVAMAVASRLGVPGIPSDVALPEGVATGFVDALVRDLQAHRGASIVIAGNYQQPAVHALAHAMNAALGNVGKTVLYTDPVVARPADLTAQLSALVYEMNAGAVQLLVILSANPVYSAPADVDFATALKKVKTSVHLGLYADETASVCNWHVPETHFLEAWSDARAFDGTATIVQPLIEPLYPDARSPHEILTLFGGAEGKSYDQVRGYWQGKQSGGDFETWWRNALNRGVIPDSAFPAVTPTLDQRAITSAVQAAAGATPGQGLEVNFRPDPAIWDGRFANNAWLQELPKPLNLLTWDNAVMMSPATAEKLGVQLEDLVELRYSGRSVRGGVWIWPGHVDDSITVHLGYGQSQTGAGTVPSSSAGSSTGIGGSPEFFPSGGPLGSGTGFNAYALRTSEAPWFGSGGEVAKVGGKYQLATTQFHWQMDGRELVKTGTLAEYQQNPNFAATPQESISLYPQWEYPNYKWGMAIDLTTCIGCNACVLACQAENNVPTVGKEGVYRQREMHWLRVDRYYEGTNLDDPQTVFQPVPCMQCETAPCEAVCPVAATSHSEDGLNDMTYNRCVGTRYCSNNCPYKVRRFNFFSYTDQVREEPLLKMVQNPDVTVRNRGVMEKCTYCVQRIREAQGTAETEGRPIREGEVIPACAAACPTHAISFGNLNDQSAEVNAWKALPLNYALLAELNTQPRTTYLAGLRNPNPEIAA